MPLKKVISKAKFNENDRVSFDVDGDILVGTVLEVEGKNITVQGDDNENYVCDASELTLVAPDEDPNDDVIPDIKPKGVIKKAKPADDEDEPEPEEEPEEEAKSVKKSPLKKAKPADDEDETPAKSVKKGKSFGSFLRKVKPAEDAALGIPVGDWEALITDAQIVEKEDGSISAYLEFTVVNDEDLAGRTARGYSQIQNAAGEEEKGAGYFVRDLIKLGYNDLDAVETVEDFQDILTDLAKTQPWVTISVKPQKNKPGYVNIFLQGLQENQEGKPELE